MRARPGDFAQPVAPAPTAGDTPADHPGMSRAPKYDPPATIQVVRPERTIVRSLCRHLFAGRSRPL
jgi:hypothetical protein